jgi:hypothetical protein
MRAGNQMDGLYFFLLFAPIVLSIWAGDLLRKRIVSHLLLDCFWSQYLSVFIGVSVQILIMITGVLAGYFLVKLI